MFASSFNNFSGPIENFLSRNDNFHVAAALCIRPQKNSGAHWLLSFS